MSESLSASPRRDARRATRRGRLSLPLVLSVIAGVAAATILAYAPAAQWLSDYNQSLVISGHNATLQDADPGPAEQLADARAYNEALSSGAILAAGANVPSSDAADTEFDYEKLLHSPTGVMARIQIPTINVDLPVYHGTDDDTLLRGAGHLEGTSLPVGGEDTHSVITAHRGLPDATMFTDLDKVAIGDLFTVTTFGEVLTYRVIDARVVEPDATETLRQEAGRDLMTLVTCTPLGINTHRMLITGERTTPTPPEAITAALGDPDGQGFPWWAVAYLGALLAIGVYVWWAVRKKRV